MKRIILVLVLLSSVFLFQQGLVAMHTDDNPWFDFKGIPADKLPPGKVVLTYTKQGDAIFVEAMVTFRDGTKDTTHELIPLTDEYRGRIIPELVFKALGFVQ